jgi:hypothetical protein
MIAPSKDVAVFELVDRDAALRLTRLLAPARGVGLLDRANTVAVSVELGDDPEDLPVLLRQVEAWIAEESLSAVRCSADGRSYLFVPGVTGSS